jgi:hypothetical protein
LNRACNTLTNKFANNIAKFAQFNALLIVQNNNIENMYNIYKMSNFECVKCGKLFDLKGNYEQHLRRTTDCSKEIEKIKCLYCPKEFTTAFAKKRHETNTCKEKKLDSKRVKFLEEKNKKLEEKLIELEEMVKKGINPVSITNNTQNNITINMHGKEDISHITEKNFIYVIMNKGFMSMQEYIKMKYFSDKKPENSNVYNSDMKSKYLMAYDGTKWIIREKKELIENMYGTNYDELEEKFCEFKYDNKIPQTILDKFSRFIDQHEDDEVKTAIKEDIKRILFNERTKSLKNKA